MLRSVTRIAAPILARTAISTPSVFRSVQPISAVAVRSIVHIARDDSDIRTLLEKNQDKLVIVDWTAAWCGPCKQIAPIYETLSEEHKGAVFIKADIDVLQDASVEAGVQSVPTFHFIKNNELVAEFSGADQMKLRALLKQHA